MKKLSFILIFVLNVFIHSTILYAHYPCTQGVLKSTLNRGCKFVFTFFPKNKFKWQQSCPPHYVDIIHTVTTFFFCNRSPQRIGHDVETELVQVPIADECVCNRWNEVSNIKHEVVKI